ncbi:MAG: hypothetical protein ACKOU7_03230 [Ferruginibacter sp.]
MKKIKSIRQLHAEKKRIKQQQEEMERRIRASWQDVKENLRPANLAKEAIGGIIRKKQPVMSMRTVCLKLLLISA